MQITIGTDLVTEIVQSIFSTMIGVETAVDEVHGRPLGDRITSSVYLEGEWNGAIVRMQSGTRLPDRRPIPCLDPPEDVNADVRDVIGELANMIGGNIQSAIATKSPFLPSVINGSNYELHVCGSGNAGTDRVPVPGRSLLGDGSGQRPNGSDESMAEPFAAPLRARA